MLKVALSPFFNDGKYEDAVSGLVFQKGRYGEIITYDVSNELNLDGVRNALRMNILILLEGEIPAPTEKKVEVVQAAVQEPEIAGETVAENVQAEEVAAPKAKTAKKK
jgi:hypothetical protein